MTYVLVDTSVWINLLGKKPSFKVEPDEVFGFVTCPPIIQEIIQGLREGSEKRILREQFLFLPRVADPVNLDLFLEAADIFSRGRRKGFTIRSSVDCLIAAIAIKERLPVWHLDRDFGAIAKFTDLDEYKPDG